MIPYFSHFFGNPSNASHLYGWESQIAIKKARQQIAQAINSSSEEIVFTSGATEANNLAIKGIAEAYFNKGRHFVTIKTEHSSILNPFLYLKNIGFELTILPVDSQGLVNLDLLQSSLRPDTVLVSIMAANNEIGVLQPLESIGQICREHQVLFHSDAAQAIGKVPLDVEKMQIDLMSLTGHKIYGPKGVGALYIRRKNPRVMIKAQLHGGNQEREIRSGTLNTPLIVGLAKALEISLSEQDEENKRLSRLKNQLWQELESKIAGIQLNGHPQQRLASNLNISIKDIDGSMLLSALQGQIALSSGSACSSDQSETSHVLKALGHSKNLARASLRFGLGRFTTEWEIQKSAKIIIESVNLLRNGK
jgi:cysteine desulfurase